MEAALLCAARWAEEMGLEEASFVVVSDSQEFKRLATELLPGRVYASATVPFHTDKSVGDALGGAVGAWVDMLLLALSDAAVISRSGFGESAAQIGLFPEGRVLRWQDVCFHDNGEPRNVA